MLNINELPIVLPPWLSEVITNNKGTPLKLQNFKNWYKNQKKIKIVLEGIPGGGKTSIIDYFKNSNNILVLQQFELFVDTTLDNQTQYIDNDIYKSKLMHESDKKFILVDRDFTSTLAFTYAKSKLYNTKEYEVLTNLYKKICGTGLFFPDIYIYLSLPPSLSLTRKERKQNESIWADSEFLKYMQEFYDNYFNYLQYIVFVITIDASKKSLKDISRYVKKLINDLL